MCTSVMWSLIWTDPLVGAVKNCSFASCVDARPSNSKPETAFSPEGATACGPPVGQGHDRGRFQRPPITACERVPKRPRHLVDLLAGVD